MSPSLEEALGIDPAATEQQQPDAELTSATAALKAAGFEDGDIAALPRERVVKLGAAQAERSAAIEAAKPKPATSKPKPKPADDDDDSRLARLEQVTYGIAEEKLHERVRAAMPEDKRGDAKLVAAATQDFIALRNGGRYEDTDQGIRAAVAAAIGTQPKQEPQPSAPRGSAGGDTLPNASNLKYWEWNRMFIEAIGTGREATIARVEAMRPAAEPTMQLFGLPQ